MSDVRCPMSDVRCPMSDVLRDVGHRWHGTSVRTAVLAHREGAVSRPTVDGPWPCSRRTELHCRLECLAECQLTAVHAVKLDGNLSVAIFRLVPADRQMSAADRAGRPGDSSADVVTHVAVPHGTQPNRRVLSRRFDCPFGRAGSRSGSRRARPSAIRPNDTAPRTFSTARLGTVPQAAFWASSPGGAETAAPASLSAMWL